MIISLNNQDILITGIKLNMIYLEHALLTCINEYHTMPLE